MGGLRFAALEDGLAPLDPFDSGGGAQEDLLGLEAAGAGVGDDAVRVGCSLAFGGEAKGEGIRGEVWGACFCVPLQLALLGFVGGGGWVQHFGWVGHGEQGAGFGVALAQGRVAGFVGLLLRGVCLELGDAALDALVVSDDLCDSQGPGFVDW